MPDISGVCAIVPRHQEGFRPKVIGMGIVVGDLEVVTCAHVINAAVGDDWFSQPGEGVVRVCFPFAEGMVCVNGTVDRGRFFPPNRPEEGKLTDIAVIRLDQPAPSSVGRAVFRGHGDDALVKIYGFRRKENGEGHWKSHPEGEIVEAKVLGSLPGGRVYIEWLRPTGASVEPGFSGAGVYDPRQGAVVGMTAQASAEVGRHNAQFIDVDSLLKALGRATLVPLVAPSKGPRTTTRVLLNQAQERKEEIEGYLREICDILPEPDTDDESPLLNFLHPILVGGTPQAASLQAAFGLPTGDRANQLYELVKGGGERMTPFLGLVAQRLNHLLWRLGYTLEYILHDWAKEGRRRAATIQTICDPHLLARQPTLRDMALVFKFSVDQALFAESAPDPTLYAVLRAFEHTQPHLPPDMRPDTQTARDAALDFLHQYLRDLLGATRPLIHDSSNAWWAVRTGFCAGDDRFRSLIPGIATKYGDVTAPPAEVSRRAAVPEIYKPLRTASYTLSNAQAIVEHNHNLDSGLVNQLHRVIHVMLNRLLVERWSKQLYLASVHHEGLRNFLDYVKDQQLDVVDDCVTPRKDGELGVRSQLPRVPAIRETSVRRNQGVPEDRDKLFISYSHRDQKFLTELLIHLKPLERAGIVSKWSDKQIAPGSQWFAEIQAALARSKLALMLVTPAFLASDFIHEHELGPLLKQAEEGGTRILWVPVRACSYKDTSLAGYQAVIDPEKPLAQMKAGRDQAWVKVCEEIKRAFQQ